MPGAAHQAAQEYSEYVREAVSSRRRSPRDDLFTRLAAWEGTGEMSAEEVVRMTIGMLIAGIHTTESLIATALLLLQQMAEERTVLATSLPSPGSRGASCWRSSSGVYPATMPDRGHDHPPVLRYAQPQSDRQLLVRSPSRCSLLSRFWRLLDASVLSRRGAVAGRSLSTRWRQLADDHAVRAPAVGPPAGAYLGCPVFRVELERFLAAPRHAVRVVAANGADEPGVVPGPACDKLRLLGGRLADHDRSGRAHLRPLAALVYAWNPRRAVKE